MSQTDFNDLAQARGLTAVNSRIKQALFSDDSAPDSPSPPVDASGPRTLADFEQLIEDSEDFDYLTEFLLRQIAKAKHLRKPAVERLIGLIAKKANTTKAALQDEFKALSARFGDNVPDTPVSEDDVVGTLNQIHAILPMGGRTVILNREFDPVMHKKFLTFSSRQDFVLKYCNKKVFMNGESVGWGDYWLEHPERAEYAGMVFLPGENEPGYLNLWQGWGCAPGEGQCGLYLAFVHEVICSGDDDLYDYILNWCAHLVQRPQELPETALVFRGREGIGKNTFIEPLARIVGQEHYLMLSSLNQVTGRFSGHLANALLIFCNESVWGGDKSAQGVLKSMITDPVQPIEYKGRDLSMVRSFRRCIFATNEQWAVPRGADDRRYVITDVSDERKGDWAYFQALNKEMREEGGTEALMAYLLGRDISAWHPRQIPDNIIKRGLDLKLMSANSVVRWWFEALMLGYLFEDGDAYSDAHKFVWPDRIKREVLGNLYLAYCKKNNISHSEQMHTVGEHLRKWGVRSTRPRENGDRPYYYVLPTIDEARGVFGQLWGVEASVWEGDD
ncbi:primase-helicase family protein [Methylomonas rapida]|uniref:DUF5906 domain-containing protein n=1 Tax=Methylomonas rapida TaxID=2963939 RepID=A0ABY7GR31_9GAMM|nr:primase-helicase family protein [Methylomonas rapida]WAR46953.1 DUF5906 domain-containing protein [Methylomonas rapida]